MFLHPSPPSIAAPAAGGPCLQPTTLPFRCSPYPQRSARAPQKPLLPRCQSPSRLLRGVLFRGLIRLSPRANPRPPLPRLASRRSRRLSRLRTESPPGLAGVRQQQLVLQPLLSIMALGPAGPLDHLPGGLTPRRESHGHGRVRPPPQPLPPRRSRRCQYRPTATAQSLRELLSYGLRPLKATHRLHLPSWMPLATMLNCSSLIPSRVIHMPIWSENGRLSRRVPPQCVTSPSAGRRPYHPTFCRAILRTSVPPFRTSRNWLEKTVAHDRRRHRPTHP